MLSEMNVSSENKRRGTMMLSLEPDMLKEEGFLSVNKSDSLG
jgi:hypothetical protein